MWGVYLSPPPLTCVHCPQTTLVRPCGETLASPSPSPHISLDKLDPKDKHRTKEMIMRTGDLPIATNIRAKIEA